MPNWLGQCTCNHNNNFNILRFFAASLVLYSHSYSLLWNHDPLSVLTGVVTFGSLAVDIFFITSGFLVANSLFGRKNILAFVWARALRIFPGLIIAVLFCVFVVGLMFTELSASEYFRDAQTLNFLIHNASLTNIMDHYSLPGVFSGRAVNGSLWTLPWELKMYAVLALVGIFIHLRPGGRIELFSKIGLILFALFSIIVAIRVRLYYEPIHVWDLTEITSRFQALFFIGTSFYIMRDKIPLTAWLAVPMSIAILSVIDQGDIFYFMYILFLPYLVLYMAYLPTGPVLRFNRLGDYSYGIYIYAYPVQKSLIALIPEISVMSIFLLALPTTLLLSIFSWHCIEKPMLKKKNGYLWLDSFLFKLKHRP